jgi:predicted dehydrogenase
VYTEWPLGRTTAEAIEMTELAKKKGVLAACGLQSRVSPALLYMKELIESGYVGRVMACNVATVRDGPLARPSSRSWQRDFSLGANALTIANGHSIDALRFVVGDFDSVATMLSTQVKQWYEPDTKQTVDVTSPDNILVSGKLKSGAMASVHTAAMPWAGHGFRMEIYGTEGTLTATGNISSQRGEMLRVRGAQKSQDLKDLPLPDKYNFVPASFPKGDPYNVGQMYALFAKAIREGKAPATLPLFDTAVELHKFTDVIKQASDEGKTLKV